MFQIRNIKRINSITIFTERVGLVFICNHIDKTGQHKLLGMYTARGIGEDSVKINKHGILVASQICKPCLLLHMWTQRNRTNRRQHTTFKRALQNYYEFFIYILEYKTSISILFMESQMVKSEVQICQQDCQPKN